MTAIAAPTVARMTDAEERGGGLAPSPRIFFRRSKEARPTALLQGLDAGQEFLHEFAAAGFDLAVQHHLAVFIEEK